MLPDESQTELSTDESILEGIGELNEPGTTEGTPGEGTGTTEDPQATPSTPGGEQGTVKGDATQQPKQVGSPQDLKDSQGNVIATGGKERRFYETAQRERTRADGLAREVETLKANADAVNSAGTLGTQYDLTPEELTTGAQIIAAYKKNPVETIQYMLTQAQAQGHNTEAISGGGMDMAAVKQLFDTSLKPLIAEQNQRNDTQEANDRALEIYNTFSSSYPDAAVHETSLTRLLQQEPNLSPEAAYFKLQSYYLKNNLDWTKSLEQLQQDQKLASPGANTQQALPEGGVTTPVTNTDEVADVNASTSDIVKDAMREAGIEIN